MPILHFYNLFHYSSWECVISYSKAPLRLWKETKTKTRLAVYAIFSLFKEWFHISPGSVSCTEDTVCIFYSLSTQQCPQKERITKGVKFLYILCICALLMFINKSAITFELGPEMSSAVNLQMPHPLP